MPHWPDQQNQDNCKLLSKEECKSKDTVHVLPSSSELSSALKPLVNCIKSALNGKAIEAV